MAQRLRRSLEEFVNERPPVFASTRSSSRRQRDRSTIVRQRWGRGELVIEMRTAARSLTNAELATLDDEVEQVSQHRSASHMGGPAGQLDPTGVRFARLKWEQAAQLVAFVVETLGLTDGAYVSSRKSTQSA
ncbi:MAG: hypothetical protein HY329_06700 [Chloroflexi bacterium]|nr:hypothetical protein [Chloroflexota bacterium]